MRLVKYIYVFHSKNKATKLKKAKDKKKEDPQINGEWT